MITKHFFLLSILAIGMLSGCDEDEGKLPNISFKTGSGYISRDTTLASGTSFVVGINASKSENVDVLKVFNISRSINNGAATTLLNQNLSGAQGDSYSYDHAITLDSAGIADKYIYTVTNRDGLTNQISVTVTVP